jgi:hypothetical protein
LAQLRGRGVKPMFADERELAIVLLFPIMEAEAAA